MKPRVRAYLALAVVTVGLGAPAHAVAQTPPSGSVSTPAADDRAAQLKKQGDDFVGQLRFADAIAAYDASYSVTPNPAVLFNKARALQGLGQYGDALATFQRFKKEAAPELLQRATGLDALIADLRGRVTLVTLNCGVPGARVLFGDRLVGVTPLAAPLAINAGHTTVEVSAEGYLPVKRSLDLVGGGTSLIEISLVARDRAGVLTVRSSVGGAHVFVDGAAMGVPPAEAPLEAGAHAVRVHADGYDDAQTSVVLGVGEHKEVTVDPSKAPGVLSKWWFWTGVGVVVAGAVVTTIALTTEKSPGTGDFQPGRVSGPLVHF
jgi:hypothetical protein